MYSTTQPLTRNVPVPLSQAAPAFVFAPVPFMPSVQAGFPSPAEDFAVKRLDLNDVLITHPLATFMMRVKGRSMRDAGIDDGDVVIVDRAIKPSHGHVVIAVVDDDFTVKRLSTTGEGFRLCAANPEFPDIVPHDGQTVEVWGVVTHTIKKMLG